MNFKVNDLVIGNDGLSNQVKGFVNDIIHKGDKIMYEVNGFWFYENEIMTGKPPKPESEYIHTIVDYFSRLRENLSLAESFMPCNLRDVQSILEYEKDTIGELLERVINMQKERAIREAKPVNQGE